MQLDERDLSLADPGVQRGWFHLEFGSHIFDGEVPRSRHVRISYSMESLGRHLDAAL
jgi:hypothetical protein